MAYDGLDFGEIGEGEKDEVADYRGRNNAVAYVLGKVDRFKENWELFKYDVRSAPQSYVYLR